jgi:hypothetical protein
LKSRYDENYYVVKDGVTEGPYKQGDPKVAEFAPSNDENKGTDNLVQMYKPWVTRSGDKYLITFAGKKYGPYAMINKFVVTQSKDKFAAIATENVAITEDEGNKMEEAMKNAKTDQERMDLAMKYSAQMQQNMMKGGDPTSIAPKLVTNVPGVTIDPMTASGLSASIKYDEICVISYDKILDLQGKILIKIKPEYAQSPLFVNSSNTKYAVAGYESLLFSDNTSFTDLFNSRLIKKDGKVFISYMYYSPKMNSIVKCNIPF